LRRLILWFLDLLYLPYQVVVKDMLFNLPQADLFAFLYHLKDSLSEGRLGSYAHYAFQLLLFDNSFLALLLESYDG